jgi:hypothetical protein
MIISLLVLTAFTIIIGGITLFDAAVYAQSSSDVSTNQTRIINFSKPIKLIQKSENTERSSSFPNAAAIMRSSPDANVMKPVKPVTNTTNTTSSNYYLTYTNSSLGISMQYTYNWIKDENQTDFASSNELVYFTSAPEATNHYAAQVQLIIDNQPQSLDLNQYLQSNIKQFQKNSIWKNFHLVQSNSNYTLAGRPAYRIIATATNTESGILNYIIGTGTVIGSKVYYLDTFIDADKITKYAPILNHMKDSFEISISDNRFNAATPTGNQTTTTIKSQSTNTSPNMTSHANNTTSVTASPSTNTTSPGITNSNNYSTSGTNISHSGLLGSPYIIQYIMVLEKYVILFREVL